MEKQRAGTPFARYSRTAGCLCRLRTQRARTLQRDLQREAGPALTEANFRIKHRNHAVLLHRVLENRYLVGRVMGELSGEKLQNVSGFLEPWSPPCA